MKITPEIADKIKATSLANIIRKVKDGKTLSASERKDIEAATSETENGADSLVTTSRIAEIFRINRKTIPQWRKENRQDVPSKVNGKESLNQWRAWFAANPSAGYGDGKPRRDRETLMCEKLEVEIAISKIKLETSSGEVIRRDEVQEDATRMYSATRGELLKLSSDLPPRLAGLGEAKMQAIIRDALHEILERLANEKGKLHQAN